MHTSISKEPSGYASRSCLIISFPPSDFCESGSDGLVPFEYLVMVVELHDQSDVPESDRNSFLAIFRYVYSKLDLWGLQSINRSGGVQDIRAKIVNILLSRRHVLGSVERTACI
jgi:hypothetical protein